MDLMHTDTKFKSMDKTKWFELWQYFNQEHNLLLLETEVQEIIEIVRRIDKDEKNTVDEMPPWMRNMDSMDIKPGQFGTVEPKLLHQTTEKRINFSKDKPLSKPLEEMMEQRSPTLCMHCQKPIIKDEASGGYWIHADVDILKDGNGYYCYKGNQVLKAEPEEWKWKLPKSKEGSSTSRIDMLDFGQFPPKYDEKP